MGDNEQRRMGDYELLERLGSGAQGQVWKARCLVAGKEFVAEGEIVAIKTLGRTSGDPNEDKRFKRQAQILEQLDHPAICRYIDYFIENEGEFDETPCLVTEYLDGQPLEDRLQRSPKGLSWDEIKPIFEQSIEGLAFAAKHEVFHRDLKPSNIFITREGKAKIIDFGIARQTGGEETSSGDFRGSFDYMAPDFVLIEGFKGDERSDIFSMGVCFYKALTGQLPFEPLGDGAHIGYLNRWKHADEQRPSFRHNAFRVLTKVKGFVQAALAVDLEERFQNFEEMREALGDIKYRVVRHKGVADYELIDVLGRGGFGEVFKGRVVETSKLVAIKHLFAGRQESRFLKEAKLLQRYKHPDIVSYVDFIEVEGLGDDKEYFLVMEYLPGMPGAALNQRIRKARYGMEPAEVIETFIHFLSALQFLHESPRPIIHRDIKPGNLYAPPGQPQKSKLFDLGVARDVSGTMTTGMIPGTLDYMAPEFAKPGSDRGTPQSDIYAMGVSMYEALTGRKPYPKLPKSDQEAFVQFVARAQNPPEVSYRYPVFREIPQLERVCRRAMAPNPDDRYRSAGQMLNDLTALMEQVAGERVDPEEAPTRATIADPALIERLREHAKGRPALIPESEMKDLLEESSRQSVERRPDWMEEDEGGYAESAYGSPAGRVSPSPIPAPGSSAAAAAPAAVVEPKAKASPVKWIAVAAAVALLAVGGYFAWETFGPRSPEDIRTDFVETVQALSAPQPNEAYVRRLLSLMAQARERKLEDATYDVWWDNQIAQISEIGENIPETFQQAFTESVDHGDLTRAESLQADWGNLGDAVPFMGMTQREYLVQADDMDGQIGRFHFTAAVREIRRNLPETVDGANLDQVEAVAKKFRSLRAQRWEEVPQAEREAVYEEIGSALTARTEAFLQQQRERILDTYAAGNDGAAGVDLLSAMSERAPSLVGLTEPMYKSVVAEVTAERTQYDQMVELRQSIARLREAVPEAIESPPQLAQAEEAFAATTEEMTAVWDGISAEEKQGVLQEIRTNLVQMARGYVDSLSAEAIAWYENDEPDTSSAGEDLQGLMEQAPNLMRSVGGAYADAVSRVDQARQDRDKRWREAELARARRLREMEEAKARAAREAELAANRQAFAESVAQLREQLPGGEAPALDLAQAEDAAEGVRAFAETRWPDVSEEEKDAVVQELTQTLRSRAADYVTQLRDRAVEQFERNQAEEAVPEWQQLSALGQTYPTLIALLEARYDQAVEEAESALLRAQGVNAFSRALSNLRREIPSRIASPAELAQAEAAAVQFREIREKPWDVVSAEERDQAFSRIESTLSRRVGGYVRELQEEALARYEAMEDGSASLERLSGLETAAPTLRSLVQPAYDAALAEVRQAARTYREREAFRRALARLDEVIPSKAETAADIAALEQAAIRYREVAQEEWPGIEAADRDQRLAVRAASIDGLARSYLLGLQDRALEAYANGEDGGPQVLELRSMASIAPTLIERIEGDFAQVMTSVGQAAEAREIRQKFFASRNRILEAIPADIAGVQDLNRLEQAVDAYDAAKDREWEGVPPGERLAAFEEIRRRLVERGRTYVKSLETRALEQYRALEDGDPIRDDLIALRTIAPDAVDLLEPAYPAALQAVDAARADKERRLREIAAEEERQRQERLQRERLARLSAEEQQRLQEVQAAWERVQQAWQSGSDQDLAPLYDRILSPQFEVEELQESYRGIKVSFLNGLKSRLSGEVEAANQAIAAFTAYLYQVEDPSFSGSYRVTIERPPEVAFALPNLQEIEDVDMGYSKAELIRLQAWKKAGPTLDREATQRELADRLKVLSAASRKQGQVELAARSEMEAALLVSDPAVFPPFLDDIADPPEIYRWRAHASYQPEGSALDVLRDMERYASRGGVINDYDVRLAMFASYYSWRNAIEGESEYAGRVKRSLDAVLKQADERAAQRALDYLIAYIEEGTDDLMEFPGLYMMRALTMMNSSSPMAQQAEQWLKREGEQYAARFAMISSQLDLLQRLLGT